MRKRAHIGFGVESLEGAPADAVAAIFGGGSRRKLICADFVPPIKELTVGWQRICSQYMKVKEDALLCVQRRNEMLGLGLLGTIIVIVVIVWLVRMV